MAQNTPPLLIRRPATPEEEQLAALGLTPSSIDQMAAQGKPKPPVVSVNKKVVAQNAPPAASPWTGMGPGESRSEGEKRTEKSLSPELEAQASALRTQMNGMQKQRFGVEQAGIDDYQKDLKKYQDKPTDIDWRGLASLVDRFGDGSTYKAASDMKPETPEEKQAKLMAMKGQLQTMKGSLSKSQYDALKDQLDSYNAQMNTISAEKRASAAQDMNMMRYNNLNERNDEKNIQKLADKTTEKAGFNTALDTLEANLGFKLDEYDSSNNTANGKSVDLPGASVPGIGRVKFYNEKARRIEDTMSNIFNTVLKDRSGAAVTNQEMERLRNEFSSGKFQTEAEKIQAVKDFKRATNEAYNRAESAFQDRIRKTYDQRVNQSDNKRSDRTPITTINAPIAGDAPDLAGAAAAEIARRKAAKN